MIVTFAVGRDLHENCPLSLYLRVFGRDVSLFWVFVSLSTNREWNQPHREIRKIIKMLAAIHRMESDPCFPWPGTPRVCLLPCTMSQFLFPPLHCLWGKFVQWFHFSNSTFKLNGSAWRGLWSTRRQWEPHRNVHKDKSAYSVGGNCISGLKAASESPHFFHGVRAFWFVLVLKSFSALCSWGTAPHVSSFVRLFIF